MDNVQESTEEIVLITNISVRAKTNPHPEVLTGTSGRLDETPEGTHVFVFDAGSHEHNGGPQEGALYKIAFTVVGTPEAIQQVTFIGHTVQFGRYVFTKKTR